MKVLVVHDRPEAMVAIVAAINEIDKIDAEIICVGDGASAKAALQNQLFDLLIIDLTLPYIKGKTEINFSVARDLLQELFALGTFPPPGDIIGVTREPDAHIAISGNIGAHLMAIIAENEDGAWLGALKDKIIYASRCAEARQFLYYRHFGLDCLIILALDEEFEPFKVRFDLTANKHMSGAFDFIFRDKEDQIRKGVIYPIGKSGQPRVASYTQTFISVFRPKLVLMSGICGGFENKMSFGDLALIETVYDWDYGKWSDEEPVTLERTASQAEPKETKAVFFSRPSPLSITSSQAHSVAREFVRSDFHLGPELKRQVKQLSLGKITEFKTEIVHAASGSAVVAHQDIVDRISGLSDAIKVVDMECYGLYQAALKTHVAEPEVLCLKSVSDLANQKKDDAIHAACCEISCAAAFEIMTKYWIF